MPFMHKPVLLQEVLNLLAPQPGALFVDCTTGGGGHSKAILERILPGGRLLALDQDMEAIEAARQVLTPLGEENFELIWSNFEQLPQVLKTQAIDWVDGLLYDLGVSSHQLDEGERGFSYQQDAPLDMRMNKQAEKTAHELVNQCSEVELTKIIRDYGEENWAKRIAHFIVLAREQKEIKTTGELVDIIKKAIPSGARREGPHPAKRTFQALRIAVNRELEILEASLRAGVAALRPGGRMGVITFHSLEDRIVKGVFRDLAQGCTCPKTLPLCVCQNKPLVKNLTGKPWTASPSELEENPRARSAKLRVAEKL